MRTRAVNSALDRSAIDKRCRGANGDVGGVAGEGDVAAVRNWVRSELRSSGAAERRGAIVEKRWGVIDRSVVKMATRSKTHKTDLSKALLKLS